MESKFERARKAKTLHKKADNNFLIGFTSIFIILIVGIYYLIKFLEQKFPHIDLYKTPFLVDVWGTVADWVMIIVTAITAFLLILSFRAQKKANDIAYKNYQIAIKPKFSVNGGIKNIGGNAGYIIEIEVHNNAVYCIELKNIDYNYVIEPSQYMNADTLFPGGRYYILLSNNITSIIGDNAEGHLLTEIVFTDSDYNYYKQILFSTITNSVYLTDPEPIVL